MKIDDVQLMTVGSHNVLIVRATCSPAQSCNLLAKVLSKKFEVHF